jgi:hypothetical protein
VTPSKVWAFLDDPRDVVRHDTAGERAEPGILSRFQKWLALQDDPDKVERYCDHGSYTGFVRSLAFLCPRCPGYAEAADSSHPLPQWDDEGEFPAGFKKVAE